MEKNNKSPINEPQDRPRRRFNRGDGLIVTVLLLVAISLCWPETRPEFVKGSTHNYYRASTVEERATRIIKENPLIGEINLSYTILTYLLTV